MFLFFNFDINTSIIMLNNNGERGQPCLTPELIFIFLVVLPLLLMIVTLSLYISNIPSITSSGIPFLVIPFVIDLCDTVSKVFAKSKKTMLYSLLLDDLLQNFYILEAAI